MPEPVRPIEQWVLAKPPKISDRGIVVAQHWRAAEAGAEILAQGGNAVDAAVATALALGGVTGPGARRGEGGLPVDWHSILNVSLCAAELGDSSGSRAVYLPNDPPPVPPPANTVSYLPLRALARTYRRLQKVGPRDFY